MQYRPEIDGLRAVAVVPVILFHVGFDAFSGGFVGVDVFFVISGFLITSLMLSDMGNERFSLLGFYGRRARRILPALFCVMMICLPLAWITMVPFQLYDFSQSLLATFAFSSNFLFYIETGYFEAEAELKPLLHTWSLAVEEQYYILFPLIMILIWRITKMFGQNESKAAGSNLEASVKPVQSRWVMVFIFGLMASISLAWSQWAVNNSQTAAFYLLPSRGWEILAGSLAALCIYRGSRKNTAFSLHIEQLLSAFGFICILISIFLFDENTLFPGISAIIPVGGTVLVLLFALPGTLVHSLLSRPGLVAVGLVSYSAYLWHQPLIAYSRLYFGLDLTLVLRLALLVVTGVLSVLSWRFVETPIRRRGAMKLGRLVAISAVIVTTIVAFAFFGLRTNGFYNAKVAMIPVEFTRYIIDRTEEYNRRSVVLNALPDIRILPFDENLDTKVLIVGDSISDDLVLSLNPDLSNIKGYQFRRIRLDDVCVRVASEALRNRKKPLDPSSDCDAEVMNLIQSELYKQAHEIVLHTNFQPNNADDAGPFLREILADGKKATVVGVMVFNDIPSISMKLHRSENSPEEAFYEAIRSKYLVVNDKLKLHANDIPGARYLDKLSLFCFAGTKRCEIVDENNVPFFVDGNHMTVNGFKIFGQKIHENEWFLSDGE